MTEDDPWRAIRAPFQLPATWQPTFGTCSRCGQDAISNDGLWWHDSGRGCGYRAEFQPDPPSHPHLGDDMPYTPDPARVRELATQLIMHGARTRSDANDVLANIAENEQFGMGDDGDTNWAVLMAAVEAAAETATVSVNFPT